MNEEAIKDAMIMLSAIRVLTLLEPFLADIECKLLDGDVTGDLDRRMADLEQFYSTELKVLMDKLDPAANLQSITSLYHLLNHINENAQRASDTMYEKVIARIATMQ